MRSILFWALAVFLILVGAGIISGSIASWNETVEFVARASHAKGVVVLVAQGPASQTHRPTSAPIVASGA